MNKTETQLATELHEIWRKTRKLEDGSYEPRLKDTKDKAWIKKNNQSTVVDIANTEFSKLPTDWQKENNLAAKSAIESLSFHPDGSQDLEKTSSLIHKDWVERNPWASAHLKADYANLSEEEKKKDREIARLAFQVSSQKTC